MRQLKGIWGKIFFVFALVFGLVTIYVATLGRLNPWWIGFFYVAGFGLTLTFALYPFNKSSPKDRPSIMDIVLILATLVCVTYSLANAVRFQSIVFANDTDVYFGTVIILLIMEAARRTAGVVLPLLVLIAFAYTFFGRFIPGSFQPPVYSYPSVIQFIYIPDSSLLGTVTWIIGSMVSIFIVFAAVLLHTGAGDVFAKMANLIAGRVTGGAALTAVVSSGLFGMISGSAVANVATTGSFTIPLMKKVGYAPEFAAAVEATASTGGPVTPPVMGVSAFIMAEFLGVPYLKIVIIAILPALLYYTGVGFGVYFRSKRRNIAPLPKELIPKPREVFNMQALAVLSSIGVLLFFLLNGFTPQWSCAWALLTVTFILLFVMRPIRDIKGRFLKLIRGLTEGARNLAGLFAMGLSIQIMLSMINLTGVGIKFSSVILSVSGDSFLGALLITAVAILVLGMGIVPSAAYVISVAVLAGAVIKTGLDPISAHYFILYLANFAAITPPMCLSVFIAARIANVHWVKASFYAVQLGVAAFLVPFVWALGNKGLLLMGSPADIVYSMVFASLGVFLLSAGMFGYLARAATWFERVLLCLAGFALLFLQSNVTVVAIATGAAVAVFLFQKFVRRPALA